MNTPMSAALVRVAAMFCVVTWAWADVARADQTLEVGPGRPFARIEDALAQARAGDTILVHPLGDGLAYEQVALQIHTPRLRLLAAPDPDPDPDPPTRDAPGGAAHDALTRPRRVSLRGEGFEYSGFGPIPRAIVQVDPGADGVVIEGFEISGARNSRHNGAGVRINQANHVTIRSCHIHDNEMGIMSNGGEPDAASDQRIERCLIHSNGSPVRDGMSHNLYLGGTSAVLSGCEVHSSISGNNIKSRAHYTRIEYCWVHDSANRELDLVDEQGDTDRPESDAIVIGCILSKAADMSGNRNVIHFGQDGGHDHTGTLTIVNSTIISPYYTAVVTLTASGARVVLANNLFSDGGSGQRNQTLVEVSGPLGDEQRWGGARVVASNNAWRGGFGDARGTRLASPIRFADAASGDFRVLAPDEAMHLTGGAIAGLELRPAPGREDDRPGTPLQRYAHPHSHCPRHDDEAPTLGAWPAQP